VTARRPTNRLTRIEPRAPAPRELQRLVIDYPNAEAFLEDYDHNLRLNATLIETSRRIEPGTIVEIELAFPGLREKLLVSALVRSLHEAPPGIAVELLDPTVGRLAGAVERIRSRDPKAVGNVYNVLIVEDNHHVCELVCNGLAASTRRELRDVQFAFETAENGAIALDLLKRRSFHAAIIDLYLPVMDGATLIQHTRKTLGLTSLPIITMSGGGESARSAALRAGTSVFLDKPVRLRDVVATMRQLIGV
jgi:CheY-like chemotaxis protein